jgi:hypothetical protein
LRLDLSGYSVAFRLLYRDLLEVFEHVEPVSAHQAVYSHRLFALLLRACTDFESVAREALVALGSPKPASAMNVLDYRTLEPTYQLEPSVATLNLSQTAPLRFEPYRGWSTQKSPLPWYAAYNAVKHNRREEFRRANIENVVTAVGALLALLSVASEYAWDETASGLDATGHVEVWYDALNISGLPRIGLFR